MRLASLLFVPFFAMFGLVTVVAAAAYADGPRNVYVADLYGGQIVVFRGAKTSIIAGSKTRLRNPISVQPQASGDVVVANGPIFTHHKPGFIETFPVGQGNLAPKFVIDCKTLWPWQIALDQSGNIWVANYEPGNPSNAAVRVYAPDAHGCPAPLAEIAGPNTQLSEPLAVALDRKGRIDVLNLDNSVLIFKPGSNGNVAPVARITGTNTQINHPEGMALDSTGNIYVANYDANGSIVEFDHNANGNVAPIRVIAGENTLLGATIGLAVNRNNGKIYAANLDSHSVLVFAADAQGNVAPVEQLQGPLQGPSGAALPTVR